MIPSPHTVTQPRLTPLRRDLPLIPAVAPGIDCEIFRIEPFYLKIPMVFIIPYQIACVCYGSAVRPINSTHPPIPAVRAHPPHPPAARNIPGTKGFRVPLPTPAAKPRLAPTHFASLILLSGCRSPGTVQSWKSALTRIITLRENEGPSFDCHYPQKK